MMAMDEEKKTARGTTAEKKATKKTGENKTTEKKTATKKTAEKKTAEKNAPEKINEKKPGENKIKNKIKVTLIRSVIGTKESHRATVRGLGLKRLNHSVDLSDTPAVRGMINKVSYLLKMEASR